MQRKIRIGTRGSQLALFQAHLVQSLIADHLVVSKEAADEVVPLTIIKTSGDRIQDRPLNEIGGKGLFTKEIEEALVADEIDLAVHSMKDMPTVLPDGLILTCVLKREDPRDAFLSPIADRLVDLPQGAVVGSTSLRRQAQILAQRPDLKVVTYRGNVDTRIKKLKDGEVAATLLAVAGLNRLKLDHEITEALDDRVMLPAVAQGAITIETRSGDGELRALLSNLNDQPTELCVTAERAFMKILDGSCRTPMAGFAQMEEDGQMFFRGQVLMPDGSEAHDVEGRSAVSSVSEAEQFGKAQGEALRARAGEDFFDRLLERLS